jgi:hypothetical protein
LALKSTTYFHLARASMVAAVIALTSAPAAAQQNTQPGVLGSVIGQFNELSVRPDPMGWDIGKALDASMPDPTTCRHYEGIARVNSADGTPYFYFTRSGLNAGVPVVCSGPHEPGNLIVVRMGSREKHGERLRSNRLLKGNSFTDTPSDPDCDADYPNCLRDLAIKQIRLDGTGGWPHYGHPESMQTVGDILVVGVDTPLGGGTQPMQVLFINVADPENPYLVNRFLPKDPAINGGIVAITPMANGRFLLAITGAKNSDGVFNEKIYFFESLPKEGCTGDCSTLATADFQPWDTWDSNDSTDRDYLDQSWPTLKGREHQMLQFLRQGTVAGTLFLAGARGGINLLDLIRIGDDMLDLYRIDFIGCQSPGCDIRLKLVSNVKKHSHPNLEPDFRTTGPGSFVLGSDTANFAAASTFYVTPSGELLFYASEHENSGAAGTVRMGEWRHRDMARPNSPTFRPGARFFGPYSVAEGSQTWLGGQGEQPVTKAWIQFFDKTNFQGHDGRYLTADFLDWSKDDFNDFKHFEGTPFDLHSGFNDEASSWRWFAPSTCTVRANDNHIGADSFPGDRTKALNGFGQSLADADLSNVSADTPGAGDMDGVVTSVQFLKTGTNEDCDYYSYRPEIFWDLDRNGTYNGRGMLVTFSAAELDGPSVYEIPITSVHPIDHQEGKTTFRVGITNVAPTITQFGIFNTLNQQLGVNVPYFIERVPVTLRGAFTDPGKPDHQSAVITWGDGVINRSQNGFEAFNDAFGGVLGELRHSHRYATAGTYGLALNVTDDDTGQVSQQAQVPVRTVTQSLQDIIAQLKQLLATTTDPTLRRLYESARRALEGAVAEVSRDGADGHLEPPTVVSALAKVDVSLRALTEAQAAGADVTGLMALLQQVAAALQMP